MLHLEDVVEEIPTKRQGKIDSISSEVVQGRETANLGACAFRMERTIDEIHQKQTETALD
jgi:hypothetical protein